MGTVVKTEQCPQCAALGKDASKNNLNIYENGTTYCFACSGSPKKVRPMIQGQCLDLFKTRRLTQDTCLFFDYQVGKYTGYLKDTVNKKNVYVTDEWVQIANIYQNGVKIGQKIKNSQKWFTKLGKTKDWPPYGSWKYTPKDNMFITVVEGEIDAMSVGQVLGLQFPVVSVPDGAGSAYKMFKEHLQWFMGFKYVVLALDNDEAGQKATQKCLELFEYGKLRIAQWPGKDANDLLKEGNDNLIKSTIYNASVIKLENIVSVGDIIERVMQKPKYGLPYPWAPMSEITYGQREGEIHIVVAANGIGKTEFMTKLMFHFTNIEAIKEAFNQLPSWVCPEDLKPAKIGLFSFEQDPEDTLRRLVGDQMKLKLHLPGTEWDENKIREVAMSLDERIYLCENAGGMEIDELFRSIRYLAKVRDVNMFVIDNLRGLGIGYDIEVAGNFMKRLQTLCRELKINVYLLSHVAKDKRTSQVYVSTSPKNREEYASMSAEDVEGLIQKPGMDWESGRMPTTTNIDGPSVVGDLANYIWALARHKTSEDLNVASILRVKNLKARLDGPKTGSIFKLLYTKEGEYVLVGGNSSAYSDQGDVY